MTTQRLAERGIDRLTGMQREVLDARRRVRAELDAVQTDEGDRNRTADGARTERETRRRKVREQAVVRGERLADDVEQAWAGIGAYTRRAGEVRPGDAEATAREGAAWQRIEPIMRARGPARVLRDADVDECRAFLRNIARWLDLADAERVAAGRDGLIGAMRVENGEGAGQSREALILAARERLADALADAGERDEAERLRMRLSGERLVEAARAAVEGFITEHRAEAEGRPSAGIGLRSALASRSMARGTA